MGPTFPVGRGRVTAAAARAFAGIVAALFVAREAAAVDPFEIQVYDGTANAPGSPGVELHVNRVFSGVTTADPPELPMNHRTHMTLEPSYGLTPWCEVGGYFQTALRGDGTFDYAGTKLRSKFVAPKGMHPHARVGVNLEVSLLPERYDRNRWGGEVRPIVAWEDERWIFALNPILGIAFAGPDASAGPTFEPAAMAKVKIAEVVAVGVEYYASFGPVSAPAPWARELHYIYEVVDWLGVPHFELNVGLGEGLTASSNGLVAKVIVGYSWESSAPKERAPLGRLWPGPPSRDAL
jgi:hypothetical protein